VELLVLLVLLLLLLLLELQSKEENDYSARQHSMKSLDLRGSVLVKLS